MGAARVAEADIDALPPMLTVEEAASVLRIGRTLAYRLASDFLAGDVHGLPVIRLGGCLRVPRWALIEFLHHGRVVSDLGAAVTAAIDVLVDEAASMTPATNPRRTRTRSSAQLSLAIES
jgi:excisionase family DNA binding protein